MKANAKGVGQPNLAIQFMMLSFTQVYFATVNLLFLTDRNYLGVLIIGFIISLLWTANVSRVVAGSIKDRLLYALSASLGSLTGLVSEDFLQQVLP